MSFLAPAALLGLGLLAAPILIHLFRPRKTQRIPFSSLRWLKESSQEVSRRIEWHHWLLFLLRAGLLVLVVLALARPFWMGSDASPPRDRFVIVDRSRSMDYRAADLPTPWERAMKLAAAASQGNRPGDRTALLTIDQSPQILAPLSAGGAASVSLQAMKPGFGETHLGSALPVVQAMASEEESERPIELVVFSDFHSASLQAAQVQRFMSEVRRPVRVRLVPLGISGGNGWIADARLLPPDDKGTRRIAIELGASGDAPQARTLRILAPPSGDAPEAELAAATSIRLVPGQKNRVVVPLASRELSPRGDCRLRLDPPDGLASDDTLDITLDAAAALRVVLLEPGNIDSQGRTPGLPLRSALESLDRSGRQSLQWIVRTPATLTPADLEDAEVVIAASWPALSSSLAQRIKQRVEAGLGLAIFAGPQLPAEPADWNWLPYEASAVVIEPPAPVHWMRVDWNHPLLSLLGDSQLADLPRSQFSRYSRLTPTPGFSGSAAVLASYPDGTPAISDCRIGEGSLVIFNTSANDAWSDLPLRRSFVPLTDRLLTHLARRVGQQAFFVGAPIRLPLPNGWTSETVRLLAPSGNSSKLRIELRAGRNWAAIPPAEEPGIYRIESSSGENDRVSFAVRVGAGDRSLAPIESQSLRSWWSPAEVEVLSSDDAASRFAAEEGPGDWTPWLLLGAAAFLLAETLYGTWITPLRTAESAPASAAGGSP